MVCFCRFLNRVLSLAKQNVVVSNIEAGHDRVAEPPQRFEAKQVPIELF
jgi:hypothetical protein